MHSLRGTSRAKSIGRFYTDVSTAAFVTELAIVDSCHTLLDPACGNGVFLIEASKRLRALGSAQALSMIGIDLDDEACSEAETVAMKAAHDTEMRIINRDFFSVTAEEIGKVEVVLGNPPFVRYQTFSGNLRPRALKPARKAGVSLNRMSNAWAPFVVHAMSFLQRGGRLALILPTELLHAQYASPVIRHLLAQFKRVRIFTFEAPLFPSLYVHVVVLIAEVAGSECKDFQIVRVRNLPDRAQWITTAETIEQHRLSECRTGGTTRVSEYYLPPRIRSIYRKVEASGLVRSIGELAAVNIGYVTGDHEYFHLTTDAIKRWGIPAGLRVRALRTARNNKGGIFTENDWARLRKMNSACYLLRIPPGSNGSALRKVQPYLAEGIRRGVNQRYQCSTRRPWYGVRGVRIGDGFLTSMSNGVPRLILNEAGVAGSNNVHVVTCRPPVNSSTFRAIVASWYSSYSLVSAIIEGHVLGGGLHKLEPSEA